MGNKAYDRARGYSDAINNNTTVSFVGSREYYEGFKVGM